MSEEQMLFIVWKNNSPRAEGIVAQFQPQLTLHYIHHPRLKAVPFLTPVRYLLSAIRTWNCLRKHQPRIVFVQNPAIFAPLVVFFYSRLHKRVHFVIDAHSSCFNSSRWRWGLPIQRWLSKFASVTLVHNEEVLDYTRDWPGKVLVLDDAPMEIPLDDGGQPKGGFKKILVVSSFAWDEPIPVVLEAARRIPDVEFHITGDYTRADGTLMKTKPPNVFFTGYLPKDVYFQRLRSANAVMVLTTRDNTMQQGAWEALYCEQPIILSDQRTLRSYFDRGAVFVSNTVEGIVQGVEEMRQQEAKLRDEMASLAPIKRQRWNEQIEEIKQIVALPSTFS